MKKTAKKILTIVMAAGIAFTMFVTPAYAADTKEVVSPELALL
jgi:hypothetical protein